MSQGVVGRALSFVRDSLRSQVQGVHADELRAAQREVMLNRVVILVWVGCFMMPFAIFLFVGLRAPTRFSTAFTIVASAVIAALVLRTLVKRHLFDRHDHLAVFLLVGCVFGPVAGSVCELVQVDGANYFFAYFLICLAFVTLFPMNVSWVVAVSFALIASYAVPALYVRPQVLENGTFTTNLLYMIDLTALNVIFNRVVSAMFFDERRARIELRQARDALLGEMEVAQEIQTLLLPKEATLPNHDIRGVMLPATEVGGDYFDVVQTSNGRRFVAIGDVSGHGVTSGLTMMMARSSLLGSLESDPTATVEELFASLNTALRRNLERMRLHLYMTFILIEDLGEGRYRAIGSHLPLMVWRSRSRTVEEIDLRGVWLGLLDKLPPGCVQGQDVALDKGDHLLLYTDGIIESMNGDEMFGVDRLRAVFARTAERGPKDAVATILREVESFGGDRSDDMTLLALHYKGAGAPLVSQVA